MRRDIALVVDDSPGTLGLLNDALEESGLTVLVAQSGEAALEIVARITPDIVLMDAIMPGMDGFEACRRLKRLPALAGVPVLFMTGLTETEHVLRALEAGGVDYVTKPVAPQEVLARMRVHLTNARLTQSAQAALDAAGRYLIAIGPDGRPRWATPQAARLLGLAAQTPLAESALPEALLPWALRCREMPSGADRTLRIEGLGAGPVDFVYVGESGPGEMLIRVSAVDATSGEALLRERFALTAREAEVLLWLGRGKTNRDIAEILALSPRTVNKHLEQVFAKLGVENRATAAAMVERTLAARRG